jgi:hypothetical protein
VTVDPFSDPAARLTALLAPVQDAAARVGPGSRYAAVGTAVHDPDGERPVVHLRRRVVPRPERLATIGTHVVADRERSDSVAASALGDPELYWRLCDGNREVRAEDLVAEVGRRLRVTAPDALPGGAP